MESTKTLRTLAALLLTSGTCALVADRLVSAYTSKFSEFYACPLMYAKTAVFSTVVLIIVGLQFLSARYGTASYFAWHRFFALGGFLGLFGIFAAAVIYERYVVYALRNAATVESPFSRLYSVFYDYRCSTATGINCVCDYYGRVGDCSDQEKELVYYGEVPSKMWFQMVELLEKTRNCAGFSQQLSRRYYVGISSHSPDECTADLMADFVLSNLDGFWIVQLVSWIVVGLAGINAVAAFWHYRVLCRHIDGDGMIVEPVAVYSYASQLLDQQVRRSVRTPN